MLQIKELWLYWQETQHLDVGHHNESVGQCGFSIQLIK